MTSFLIDTSSNYVTVAIYKEGEESNCYHQLINNDLSSEIFSIIGDVFKKSKVLPNDIDAIYTVNGPGSFTGVRIGVTIAKVMAYTLNKKIIPISSLELMASGSDSRYIMPIIDARRGYVYGAIYDSNLDLVVSDSYILLDDLLSKGKEDMIICSYDKFSFGVVIPNIDVIKVIEKHKEESGVNPHLLNPNYLKKTEAEEKRG